MCRYCCIDYDDYFSFLLYGAWNFTQRTEECQYARCYTVARFCFAYLEKFFAHCREHITALNSLKSLVDKRDAVSMDIVLWNEVFDEMVIVLLPLVDAWRGKSHRAEEGDKQGKAYLGNSFLCLKVGYSIPAPP